MSFARSSSTAAAAAFAVATAGSANPKDHPKGLARFHSAGNDRRSGVRIIVLMAGSDSETAGDLWGWLMSSKIGIMD